MEDNKELAGITIFNVGANQEQMNAAMYRSQSETRLFDPKLQNDADSFAVIVRPVPSIKNPLKSLVSKNFYAFSDPMGNFLFDSRTSFNRPPEHYEFCEVSDLWLKLRNAKDPIVKDRAKQLRQQRKNYCWVVIVNYPRDPKMNGKMVPMPIPMEMVKAFERMSKPTPDNIALGHKPTQPFDIINGKNLTCQVTANKQGETLMRKWVVQEDQSSSPLLLPLGPNGAMTSITTLPQDAVEAYFTEQQDIDLEEQYGYKEPSFDIKRRVKQVLKHVAYGIPGLDVATDQYFPELAAHAPLDQNAQPSFMTPQTAGNPMALGNVPTQPMAAVEPAPVPQVVPPVPVQAAPVTQVPPVPVQAVPVAQAAPVVPEVPPVPVPAEPVAQAAPVVPPVPVPAEPVAQAAPVVPEVPPAPVVQPTEVQGIVVP